MFKLKDSLSKSLSGLCFLCNLLELDSPWVQPQHANRCAETNPFEAPREVYADQIEWMCAHVAKRDSVSTGPAALGVSLGVEGSYLPTLHQLG